MALIFNNAKVKSVIYNGTNIDCVIYNGVKVFPSSFTLYFNANGGSCNVSSVQTEEGEAYGTLPTPTRAGYSFEGWFTEPNGGVQIHDYDRALAQNWTCYAHWKQTDYTAPSLSMSSSVGGVLYQGSAYGIFTFTFSDTGSGIYGYYWGTTYPTPTNVTYTPYSGSSISLMNSGGTYYFAIKDNCGNISVLTAKCQKGSYGSSNTVIYTSGFKYFMATGNNHGGFGISDNNNKAIAYGKANDGASFDCSGYPYINANAEQGMYYIMIN